MTVVSEKRENGNQGSRVKVVGVGGGGCNAVSRLMKTSIEVEYAVINTDPGDFEGCAVPEKLLIASKQSSFLGTGGDRDLGLKAVQECRKDVEGVINGVELLFLVAGLGGGTGTGAAPEIARMARELKIPTVGVMTLPFEYEGPQRAKRAREGLEELKGIVDVLISITNDRLSDAVDDDATFNDAMNVAIDVLACAVREISENFRSRGFTMFDPGTVVKLFDGAGCEKSHAVTTVYQKG